MLENIKSDSDLKKLDINQLETLCCELRELIKDTTKTNGGHIASNLGVVELTVALHYVFNLPDDKLIFDVGHQCYTHKILTGRYNQIKSLRKLNGISGFPKREESEYDSFNTGHASTSVSAALGFAKARDLEGKNNEVIAVIGDGSFGGGMVYEALNNLSTINSKIIIILNDNEMSISKSVGGISIHLSKLRVNLKYRRLKKTTKRILGKIPLIGKCIVWLIEGFKNFIGKFALHRVSFFEHLGIKYVGPIEGNDLKELIKFLNKIKYIDQPVLLHIVTKKGKGSIKCERQPENFHGMKAVGSSSFDEYSKVLGNTLIKLAEKNNKIITISAAMTSAVGLFKFSQLYPDRFIDTGICEEHSVTLCAGLAAAGLKPYFAIYSTFLQRGFDQVLHDVCLQNLPVVFCIDRAGITGEDGETHQGVFDLSYLSLIPNMNIAVPKDVLEFKQFIEFSENFNAPLAIRYPRESKADFNRTTEIVFGKWEKLTIGKSSIIILATGEKMLLIASRLYEEFLKENITITVINARFIKPLDYDYLDSISQKNIITLEDNNLIGGFGSMVDLYYQSKEFKANVKNFGYRDEFIPQGDIDSLAMIYGIDYNEIKKYINSKII
jgi:1-deoxy-D-xylulose-5-phosphate synthase